LCEVLPTACASGRPTANRPVMAERFASVSRWCLALMGCLVAVASGCERDRDYSYARRLHLLQAKLRTSVPKSYEPISFDQFVALKPNCPFDESMAPDIDRNEKRGVMLEGYLVRLVQLAGGVTYLHLTNRGDIHLEISAAPDFHGIAPSSQRIICEITVPFQWRHKRWNLEGLAPLATAVKDNLTGHIYPGGTSGGARVRVSGYLMDDFIHCLSVGRWRATVWEIHPITRLEVWDAKRNAFVDQD
jgi:hypothetical protein